MILRTLGLALCFGLPLAAAAQTNVQPLPDWLTPQPQTVEAPPPQAFPQAGDNCCDPPPVPVDGGLSLLALAGAGYAARRLRKRRA